jgi:hypothetical protein
MHSHSQNQMPQRAASAVYTILLRQPEDKTMLSYLQFYTDLPDVDRERVEDLERAPFVDLFARAVAALSEGRHQEAVELAEKSLDGYLGAEERCRAGCGRRGSGAGSGQGDLTSINIGFICYVKLSIINVI